MTQTNKTNIESAKPYHQIDLTQSDDDDDSGFTLVYSGTKSNISMSDIKNENNTNNTLGSNFDTYRQASIEEDDGRQLDLNILNLIFGVKLGFLKFKVIECDSRNEPLNEFDSNDEICFSKYERSRPKSVKNSAQTNTKHLNQNSPRFLNFNSVNNGSRLGNRVKISKPNKPDQSVNTPYPPDLLSYFEDTSEQRPALNLPNYS